MLVERHCGTFARATLRISGEASYVQSKSVSSGCWRNTDRRSRCITPPKQLPVKSYASWSLPIAITKPTGSWRPSATR